MVNELELNLRLVDPYSPQCGAEICAGTEICKCFIGKENMTDTGGFY